MPRLLAQRIVERRPQRARGRGAGAGQAAVTPAPSERKPREKDADTTRLREGACRRPRPQGRDQARLGRERHADDQVRQLRPARLHPHAARWSARLSQRRAIRLDDGGLACRNSWGRVVRCQQGQFRDLTAPNREGLDTAPSRCAGGPGMRGMPDTTLERLAATHPARRRAGRRTAPIRASCSTRGPSAAPRSSARRPSRRSSPASARTTRR